MIRVLNILWLLPLFLMVVGNPAWSVEVGEQVPDFTLQSFNGETFTPQTLEGRPALLIFWNTWCPNCLRELPKVERLTKQVDPRELAVLAINTAINDSERKTRHYWQKHGYDFPVAFDHTFETGQAFAVRGVPTIFLIDAEGVVRYKQAVLPEDLGPRLKGKKAGP